MEARTSAGEKLVLLGAVVAVIATALEVREPLFSLGPVGFTTSELAAGFFFATVLAWAFERGAAFMFSRRALDVAVLLFIASNFLSTAFSGETGSTLKFSLRMTYAALLYFGISRLPKKPRSHLVVAATISGLVLAACVVGLLEGVFTSLPWHEILAPFRQETTAFLFFYNVRVASTLPFPTIFSFYLELAMPIVISMGLWFIWRQQDLGRRRWLLAATLLAIALMLVVQILTFTRSAYAVTPIALGIGAAAAALFGYGKRVAGVYLYGALLMIALLGTFVLASDKMAARLGVGEQEARYGAEYTLLDMPDTMEPGGEYAAAVRIRNTGSDKWKTSGPGGAEISYRWLDYPGGELHEEIPFLVTRLPHKVEPGEEFEVDVAFATPTQPGRYIFAIELAAISVDFFSGTGVPPLAIPLEFSEAGSQPFTISETAAAFNSKAPPPMSTSRQELWKAALKAWRDNPVTGMGPDQFRKRWSEYIPAVEPDERLGSHNIMLESLANTGIIGFIALVYLLARTAWVQLSMVRRRYLGMDIRLLALGLLVSTTVYFGHGMFEYPLWQTGITFMFFILLGLTGLLAAEAPESAQASKAEAVRKQPPA